MTIKQSNQTNFKDLIGKGTSMKQIMHSGGQAIAKMNAISNNQYEIIELPSKGWTYPQDSILSSGKVKIKLPTGRDEALLSSQVLQRKGTTIQQFLSALILQDFKYEDMLIGDKNYFMFMSRVLTYGKDYPAQVQCSKCGKVTKKIFDLSKIKFKQVELLFQKDKSTNIFEFQLPFSKKKVFFELNDGKKQKIMQRRLNALKSPNLQILIRTAVLIKQIDGKTQFSQILETLKGIPSRDTLALRSQIQKYTPDIDINYEVQCEHCFNIQEVSVPLTGQFFWPSGN